MVNASVLGAGYLEMLLVCEALLLQLYLAQPHCSVWERVSHLASKQLPGSAAFLCTQGETFTADCANAALGITFSIFSL